MLIDPSRLDQSVTILAESVTEDTLGQALRTWAPIATTWAGRLDFRTQDAARAGQRDTYTMARLLIRWRDDITTSHRIRLDTTVYSIVAIDQPDRRSAMILTCEEVSP